MIVFDIDFQRLDMNITFSWSTRHLLACDRRGGEFKGSCTRTDRMGRTVGREKCEAKQSFGWNEQACFWCG